MYQRHICPSVGTIRRSLAQDAASVSNCSLRSFHISARRCVGNADSSGSAHVPNEPARETRRTRSNAAFRQVTGLQTQRAQVRGPPKQADRSTAEKTSSEQGLIFRKYTPPSRDSAPPGTMVRAPANLRITRGAPGSGPSGPNLRGRSGPGGKRSGAGGRESAPKRREKKAGGPKRKRGPQDLKVEDTLSDGMVQHLLRLQRKEWDRVPYEPKYAQGSEATKELIEAGKKLFQGEEPTVKVPGPLEKRLGIAGMHGA